jgi:penicillin-binding protein 1C
VADNASGEVLAYVGNSGSSASAPFVDGVRAARQAGSTLKPFLYELAIEQRLLTAASLLDDSPVNIVTPGGLYVPQNYDRDFKGMVSLRTALSSSLNVPAVANVLAPLTVNTPPPTAAMVPRDVWPSPQVMVAL